MTLRRVLPFLPALVWAAAIWVIGGLNSVPGGQVLTGGLDKVGHFAGYAVLGLLLAKGWMAGGGRVLALVLIVAALAFGAADELRQAALSGRSAEVVDWVADAAGILTGFLLAVLYARQRRRT